MNKENFLNYEKYIILVNNVVIEVEANNKQEAIDKFKSHYNKLFDMDWTIKKVLNGISIDDKTNYYL